MMVMMEGDWMKYQLLSITFKIIKSKTFRNEQFYKMVTINFSQLSTFPKKSCCFLKEKLLNKKVGKQKQERK